MDQIVVIEHYSSLLYDCAAERSVIDKVGLDIEALESVIDKTEQLKQFFCSPVFSKQELRQVMNKFANRLKLTDLTINFINLLINNNRLNLLHNICDAFKKLNCLKNNQYQLDLVLAENVSDNFIQKMKKLLEKKIDGKINFNIIVDSKIIGGFIIKNNLFVIDNSVDNKLKKLLNNMEMK